MRISRSDAIDYAKLFGCTGDFPAVTDSEVGVIIDGCITVDMYGRPANHESWEPSYAVEMAVKNIWELKAARAAGLHDMQGGDQTLSRSQITKQCLEMAAQWRRKIPLSSTPMQGRYSWPPRHQSWRHRIINNVPDTPDTPDAELVSAEPVTASASLSHLITDIDWFVYDAVDGSSENALSISNAITAIAWDEVALSRAIANALGISNTPVAIDWVDVVVGSSVANAVGMAHVISAIGWDDAYVLFTTSNVLGLSAAISAIDWADAYTYGANEITNPGFENQLANYHVTDSTIGFYGLVSATSAAGEVHSGTYAAKLVSGTTDPANITRISQEGDTIPGHQYLLSFWAKGDGVNVPHFFIYDRTTSVNITAEPVAFSESTEWHKVEYLFSAPEGATLIRSVFYAPYVIDGYCIYDDIYFGEATEITLPTTVTEANHNTLAISSTPTAIDWETIVNQVYAADTPNSLSLTHTPTALDWYVEPENLIGNADFESDLQWWSKLDSTNGAYGTVSVSTASGEYHAGSKAAKLTAGSSNYAEYPVIYQGAEITAGKHYVFSAWSRGDGANAGVFYLYNYTTGQGITPTNISTNNATTTWHQVTYAFTASGNDTIRVYLGGPNAAGASAWWDDIWLYEGSIQTILAQDAANTAALTHTPTAIDWEEITSQITAQEAANTAALTHTPTAIDWEVSYPNLWESLNPGFESDLAYWTKSDSTNGLHGVVSITSVSGEYHTGTKAVKLAADTSTLYNTQPWVHKDVTLSPSTNYRLTFWSRGDGTNAGKFFVWDRTTNTYITPDDVSTGNVTTTWQQVTFDFTTPAGASSVRIILESPGTVGSVVYFDDCSLSQR